MSATAQMPDTIIATLHKIYALSLFGAEPEKEVAKAKLEKLLAKHGVTLEALLTDKAVERRFKYNSPSERKLLAMIIRQVVGGAAIELGQDKHKKLIFIDLTSAQFEDVNALWKFHRAAYQREVAEYYKQFAAANGLDEFVPTVTPQNIADAVGFQRPGKPPVLTTPRHIRPQIAAKSTVKTDDGWDSYRMD